MRQAKYQRKALLIISDGGDNHSRYTEGEIKSLVREADVQIYAARNFFPGCRRLRKSMEGPELLSDVTEVTGGRMFTVDNPNICRHGSEDWSRAAQPICARIPSK